LNIAFIHRVLRALYALVAALDVLILILFFGPPTVELSVRWIHGLGDWLPVVALIMLYASIATMLTLFIKGTYAAVLRGAMAWIAFILMSIYTVVAGAIFILVYTGPV